MKSFLEEYGFAILAAIVVIILIAAASPVGTVVKREVMELIKSFSWSADHKLDSLNGEISVVLTPTPSLTITSPSSTDKFDYIIHYQEGGIDKQTTSTPYDGSISMPNCDVGSNVFVEAIDQGTGNHYNSNTIVVPEGGFPTADNKTYELVSVAKFKEVLSRDNLGGRIGKIHFIDTTMPMSGVTEIDGLDADNDRGIVAWYKPCTIEGPDHSTFDAYDVYISSQKPGQKIMISDTSTSRMFDSAVFLFCELFELPMIDTSRITDMSSMFIGVTYTPAKREVNGLEYWDVSNVENFMYMFHDFGQNSKSLTIKGMDDWDVSSAVSMSNMFSLAGNKATTWNIGDLSGWDVSNVTNMTSMFSRAGSNANYQLDLSMWNVDKVTEHNFFDRSVENKIISPNWKY